MQKTDYNDYAAASESIAADAYLTKAEVALRLRKTTRTVDSYMARGILPYFKIGRSVLFRWADIQNHLDTNYKISAGFLGKNPGRNNTPTGNNMSPVSVILFASIALW